LTDCSLPYATCWDLSDHVKDWRGPASEIAPPHRKAIHGRVVVRRHAGWGVNVLSQDAVQGVKNRRALWIEALYKGEYTLLSLLDAEHRV